jgi:hypothetical protein
MSITPADLLRCETVSGAPPRDVLNGEIEGSMRGGGA